MARDDDDDDDGLPPLGENTDKFLDQAKKGQARNFLLVCKGNKVKYLAVRKKPIKKNELNEAKKSGYKGEGYFGVITGKGMELVFNLSTADGYTAEPVKDKILKDFLEEKADFKCKPSIAIVATLPAVPFDDEELNNPLIARFLGLDVLIAQVLDINPAAEAELGKTTSGIRLLLQDGEFQTAEPSINTLETRLQELLNGAPPNIPVPPSPLGPASNSQPIPPAPPVPPSTTAPTAPAPTVDNDALKLKLQEALNKLVPQLKQAVVTYPDKKVELLTPVAQIKKQMDSGDLQEAKKGILAVGQLLKSVMSQAATTPSTSESQQQAVDPLRAEYERKLAALQPLYDQALKEMLGDTGKFRTVMTYAKEQAEATVFSNAIQAIDRLSVAIQQAITVGAGANTSSGTISIAKLGKARLEWRQVKIAAMGGIKRFIDKLKEEFGDDQEQQIQLQRAIEKLESIMLDFDDSLADALDSVLNASGDAQQNAATSIAKEKMSEFIGKIDSDEVMRSIDGNSLMPELLVCAPMRARLDDIAAAFG